jgi:hypothetical protein
MPVAGPKGGKKREAEKEDTTRKGKKLKKEDKAAAGVACTP